MPSDKRQTDQVSASLQTALVSVAILRSAGHAIPVDFAELDAAVQSLANAERAIDRLSKEEAARKHDDARARKGLQQVAKRIEAIDALAPIVGAGVSELNQERRSLERQLGERTAFLAEAEAAVASLPSEKTLGRKMLSKAVVEWTEAVGAADERSDAAKRALAAFELTQSVLSSLRQRLRSSAQEIIRHTGDTTHCPLCEAEYSNLDFHFGHPGRHRYTPSARPRGPDVFVAHASGSRHRQRGVHGGHTRLNRPGSGAFLAHLSLPVLVLREPYAVTLAARQPAGTGSAQIRCSIAPNRRRVR